MNDKLISKIKDSKITAYQISKRTGIPYTTISELINEKLDINKCAAENVLRLALFLDSRVEDIMNPHPLISNSAGTYRHVKYKWKSYGNDEVALHITEDKQDKIIDVGRFNQPRFYKAYKDMTETIIDVYLEEREVEAMLND